jgi:L-lactate dehydrogenase complex protein LldG
VLAGVGGRCVVVDTLADIDRELAALETYASATKRFSGVPGCGATNFPLPPPNEPHQLDDVDFALLSGELAIAENAAVWVATDDILVRTLYFLAQHIALVVPAAAIVSNMHEAYSQLDVTRHRFGTFLSGPSKTADIEQSLVIGAHGARSQTVFLCRELR